MQFITLFSVFLHILRIFGAILCIFTVFLRNLRIFLTHFRREAPPTFTNFCLRIFAAKRRKKHLRNFFYAIRAKREKHNYAIFYVLRNFTQTLKKTLTQTVSYHSNS